MPVMISRGNDFFDLEERKADKLKSVTEDDILVASGDGGYKDSGKKISDLSSVHIGSSAPSNTKMVWIDTSSGGIFKYHNGSSWVPTKATWG